METDTIHSDNHESIFLLPLGYVGPAQRDPNAPDLGQNVFSNVHNLHLHQPVMTCLVVHSIKLVSDLTVGDLMDFF